VSNNNGESWTVNRSSIRPEQFLQRPRLPLAVGLSELTAGGIPAAQRLRLFIRTPSGRSGAAHVSRVPENSAVDLTKYEYCSQFGWLPWWIPLGFPGDFGSGQRDVGDVETTTSRSSSRCIATVRTMWSCGPRTSRRVRGSASLPGDLRPVHPPLVVGPGPLLHVVAVVALQRDVDAHHAALGGACLSPGDKAAAKVGRPATSLRCGRPDMFISNATSR
jgi:hypothetical protein